MKLVEEIRRQFSYLSNHNSHFYPVDYIPTSAPAWIFKINNEYAVGVEVNQDIKVNEQFSNVFYYTKAFTVDHEIKYLLVLSTTSGNLRNEFAGVAAMFLESGKDDLKRKEIIKEPLTWWDKWKDLLGNKNVDNTVQGLLGELLFLYYLKKLYPNDISLDNWTGPKSGSQDFVFINKKFEVKSTLIKYNDIVTVSSQFQLDNKMDNTLIFVRLEETNEYYNASNSFSINSIIKDIENLGVPYDDLNTLINNLGFKEYSQDRSKKFELLEIRSYPINENFPIISINDIPNSTNILQITYKINLSGLVFEPINLN